MPRPSIETTRGWRNKTLVDRDGAPLGRIVYIYLDEVTGEPEWTLVATGEDRRVFVPLVDAAEQADQIRIPVERALVSDAPDIRPGRQLSKEDTARLHGHYGGAPELRWASARRAPDGGPADRLLQGLDWTRERVPSQAAGGSRRTRRLLAAAASSSVAGGLLLARRRRRERPSALAGALGRAVARAARRVPAPTRTPQRSTPRKRRRRMAGNLKLLAGLTAGYVLGARAGRERYERIAEATRRLAERPEVRELTGKIRSRLGASLEKAADTASDRLQQARGEDRTDQDQDRAAAGGSAPTQRPVQGTGRNRSGSAR